MDMLTFFTDAHIPVAVVNQLRRRSIEVVRCQEVGMTESEDDVLLEHAVTNGYILLSLDDDMTKLHNQYIREGKSHTGIFYGPMKQFQGQVGSISQFLCRLRRTNYRRSGNTGRRYSQQVNFPAKVSATLV